MNVEYELKLRPLEPGLLDRLAEVERLGAFRAVHRRRECQRNSFFDTATGALGTARLAFRRRTVPGQALDTWTVKGEGELLRGVASRPEVEVQLQPDTPPLMALGILRQRAPRALAEELSDALTGSPPPRGDPFLELDTERRIVDLVDPDSVLELALDEVRLVGHPAYIEQEIEVELRRGHAEAIDMARAALEQLGAVAESEGHKLSRALAHLRACDCSA